MTTTRSTSPVSASSLPPSKKQRKHREQATTAATTTAGTRVVHRLGLPVSSLVNDSPDLGRQAEAAAAPSRNDFAPASLLRDRQNTASGSRSVCSVPRSHHVPRHAGKSRSLNGLATISPTPLRDDISSAISNLVSSTDSNVVSSAASLSSSPSPPFGSHLPPTSPGFNVNHAVSGAPRSSSIVQHSRLTEASATQHPSSIPSSRGNSSPKYDHYTAMREFSIARQNGNRITVDTSPTFARGFSSTFSPHSLPRPSQASLSGSPSSSMSLPHRKEGCEPQLPSHIGPIRTSHARGGACTPVPLRRHKPSRFESMPATPSPTGSLFSNNNSQGQSSQSYQRKYSYPAPSQSNRFDQGPSQNGSYSRVHGAESDMSPTTPTFRRPDYLARQSEMSLPPLSHLKPYQYPCANGAEGSSGSEGMSELHPRGGVHLNALRPPTNLPSAPTWATDPGSAGLPLPGPLQPRRPNMNLGNSHASAFERPTYLPTPGQTPLSSHSLSAPRMTSSPSPVRAHPFATPPSNAPTPQLTRSMTPSVSCSPILTTTPAPGGNMPSVASDQVTTQIQALAAHVGLDVHFTPKLSRADAPTKTSTATPEPGGPEDPKFDLPGTLSGSKSSRRASFATLLPTARVAPPKRSQAGQWTLEKRLIFVDRLITAGYKSLSLADLADEVRLSPHPLLPQLGLKKKQLVNQLTPGRTGSIRELCMNAAARILDPCSDCKKKQTSSKRKADREGLGEFLLRGVCGDIAEEDELDGKDIEEEEDELPDERLPEASSA